MLNLILGLSAFAGVVVTTYLVYLVGRSQSEAADVRAKLNDVASDRERVVDVLAGRERELAAMTATLSERDSELARVRSEKIAESAAASEQQQRLDVVAERLRQVHEVAQGAATKSDAARAGSERIEGQLLGFTRRIANPQSRGAFGEEALRNQLELLGLSEGRDFQRQVRAIGGSRRIDYVVHLRGTTIGVDPKFALDPDLDGLSAALAAGDDARLTDYAKKLVARAKELAGKEYWAHIERSPSFVLMYVPVEGAQEVLRALPKFSYEKFAIEHGVYIVTPLQLGTTLGVIADVAHVSRREEELDTIAAELTTLAQEMSRFCEHYHRHGRQIAAVARSYSEGAAMLSSRGGLGRIARRSMGFARRVFSLPEEVRVPEVRDDCAGMADQYRELAETQQSDAA